MVLTLLTTVASFFCWSVQGFVPEQLSTVTDHVQNLGLHLSFTAMGGSHLPGLTIDLLKPFPKELILRSEKMLVDDVRSTYETLKEAIVPMKFSNAIASVCAESAAGILGGLMSRATANVVGDKKRDSFATKTLTTGSQFFFASSTRLLGVPRPLALLLAALASTLIKIEGRAQYETAAQHHRDDNHSSCVRRSYYCVEGDIIINMDSPRSEVVASRPLQPASMFRGRQWTSQYHGDGEFIVNLDQRPAGVDAANSKSQRADFAFKPLPVVPDSGHAEVVSSTDDQAGDMANRRSIISLPEIYGDVGKWMVFDSLATHADWISRAMDGTEHSVLYFLFGTTAAVAGKLVQDFTESWARDNDSFKNASAAMTPLPSGPQARSIREVRTRETIRYGKAAVEGGVLFGTYEAALGLIATALPADWNKEFLFEEGLELLEEAVKATVPIE